MFADQILFLASTLEAGTPARLHVCFAAVCAHRMKRSCHTPLQCDSTKLLDSFLRLLLLPQGDLDGARQAPAKTENVLPSTTARLGTKFIEIDFASADVEART